MCKIRGEASRTCKKHVLYWLEGNLACRTMYKPDENLKVMRLHFLNQKLEKCSLHGQ